MPRHLMNLVVATVSLALVAATAVAVDPAPSEAVTQAIERGQAGSLERQLNGGKNAQEFNYLAQAYLNAAKRERDAKRRSEHYAKADEYFTKRIDALGRGGLSDLQRDVALAETYLDRARLLALTWTVREFEDFQITSGIRGEREWMAAKFTAAIEACREAYTVANKLYSQRDQREDEFYAAGVYDSVAGMRLDSVLVRAWARYRLGLVSEEASKRTAVFEQAEEDFRNLITFGAGGSTIYQCFLGQGLSLRELERYAAAEQSLRRVTEDEGSSPALGIQVQYELAMTKLAAGQWDAARELLKPLAREEIRSLPADLRPARFYYNLARIAFANSYLLESTDRAKQAQGDRALVRRAREIRQRGLYEFRDLGKQGGPWKAIAQLYITSSVDRLANPDTLTPLEILYATRDMRSDTPDKARRWLRSAVQRKDVDQEILPELLFELGVVDHELRKYRSAAEAFAQVARDFRSADDAPQAAAYALQLWQHAATERESLEDFAALAEAARVILESFPNHEQQEAARWTLPQALEGAGEFEAARRAYAAVPDASEHWEEAQYRSALLQRKLLDAQRDTLSDAEFKTTARQAAQMLRSYADAAFARGATLSPKRRQQVREWSATALIRAARILVSARVSGYEAALEMLKTFETTYADSPRLGEVLGVRMMALTGLRRFDEANTMITRFLAETPKERVGGVLGTVASGILSEVQHYAEQGLVGEAHDLARDTMPIFEHLVTWSQAPENAEFKPVVDMAVARIKFHSGDYAAAEELVRAQLQSSPTDGNLLILLAKILTAKLDDAGGAVNPAQLRAALDGWAALLSNPKLREQAPDVYWEALYHSMALELRGGSAEKVFKAIRQQQIWYPGMGGEPWRAKFVKLRRQAATEAGIADEQPNDNQQAEPDPNSAEAP
jgi:hypothetical protein